MDATSRPKNCTGFQVANFNFHGLRRRVDPNDKRHATTVENFELSPRQNRRIDTPNQHESAHYRSRINRSRHQDRCGEI